MERRQVWTSLAALAAAGLTLAACGTAGSPTSGASHGVGALAAASGTPTPTSCNGQPTVSATATGTASVTPDTLSMTLGVSTHGATAKAALDSDNAETAKLLGVLRHAGVPNADLQTTGLSIFPHYVKNGRVSGYDVNNTVTATVTKLSSAGAIIDSAANQVGNGIQFDNLS
ncbi:MAG: SIMPL domain-containing protein, partial [Acidimicrobiales bacterium]